jgi:hypothetical protein
MSVSGEPLLTVLVPAYRSERFIGHTLAALQAQRFGDFRVRIGLEPVEEGPTIAACRPFLADPRFELVLNERQLGWDGNVAELLRHVHTPLYVIQPHDDVLRPAYLEDLVGMLMARPDASVAYSDVLSFGSTSGRRGNVLPDAPRRSERELGFFLAGAEGHPFRGVTRSTVLTRRFSTNAHRGFAVETEWALHLVQQGVALRARRPLYLKRQPARTDASVTIGWRFGMTPDEQAAALEHNRSRLLDAIGPPEPGGVPRELVMLAAEAAMLRRWSIIPGEPLPFGEVQLTRAGQVLAATGSSTSAAGARIAAMTHAALSLHHAATGDVARSLDEARAAVRCDPTHHEASLRLAQLLLAAGQPDEAIDLLADAAAAVPLDDGVLRLLGTLTTSLDRRLAPAEPPAQPRPDR